MRTVVLAAATVLVAAFQVRDDPQSVARAERLTEAIDELASYLDPVARPEASDLTRCEDYLVPPRSHESLPFTLAEVETILRQLALRSWAHGEGRITQPYPHLSNVVWPLPGGRSLAIRVPDMAAMPVLTPGEWESLPRAYHTAPLAAWLTLPSSHRGGGIEGFWSGSAMGHMTEDVADLSSRIAESKFLTALGTASGHAAVAGGGAGTAFYLLHSVWPDAPEPASIILAAAISEMVLSLATRSRD